MRAYAAAGSTISWRDGLLVCVLCILSMDSKESGVALPVLIGCYELVFVLPGQIS